jgi:hypothetical protein
MEDGGLKTGESGWFARVGRSHRVTTLTLPNAVRWPSLSHQWERVLNPFVYFVWWSLPRAKPRGGRLPDFQLCHDFTPRYILDHEN